MAFPFLSAVHFHPSFLFVLHLLCSFFIWPEEAAFPDCSWSR
jgi:hypothetical protein